jgi:hypothetical protein
MFGPACVHEARSGQLRPTHPAVPGGCHGLDGTDGTQSWRVRYRTGDGHIASISGFTTQRSAGNYAADIESDQRRNTWLDPARGRTTVAE